MFKDLRPIRENSVRKEDCDVNPPNVYRCLPWARNSSEDIRTVDITFSAPNNPVK